MDYRSPYAKDRANDLRGEWTTGTKLQRYLYENGISKEELCRRADVSRSTVYRICAGDVIGSISTWSKIARALGCSVSDIVE